jgi:hypothetical protein
VVVGGNLVGSAALQPGAERPENGLHGSCALWFSLWPLSGIRMVTQTLGPWPGLAGSGSTSFARHSCDPCHCPPPNAIATEARRRIEDAQYEGDPRCLLPR